MAKLIIYPSGTTKEQIERERLFRNLERTPNERMKLMFRLNSLAIMFKKGPIKLPEGKGIILSKKRIIKRENVQEYFLQLKNDKELLS